MDPHAKWMKITLEILDLLKERNAKYGDRNLETYGLLGVVIRIHDKLARLEVQIASQEFDEEVVRDALKDIAGYAINSLRLLDEGRLTPTGRLEVKLDEQVYKRIAGISSDG